ncbi:hypothetical protein HMPREF1983_00599 [Gemella bergeri ATCC 700627]|uniref:Uncharacterized protein n=1 Tax=Gemella bergeri ATCC 700627 TaxID=1321820 RepID=U2QSM2_9BACL|nr:DUF2316 family protein [Gemella bergeri]ERK59224.1 hypothetical protein HMPREF1983_00599 [Gemella bergeri ATCC 700627]
MLTNLEAINTRNELQENYKRLNEDENKVLKDLEISKDELYTVLNMENPYPEHVWTVRDYFEDKLIEKGIEVFPFTKLANYNANRWVSYKTPWRK